MPLCLRRFQDFSQLILHSRHVYCIYTLIRQEPFAVSLLVIFYILPYKVRYIDKPINAIFLGAFLTHFPNVFSKISEGAR